MKPSLSTDTLLFILRVAFGILFLYAGISKISNPEWTAAGFLTNAQTFSDFYGWFASSANIGWVNFLNQWGQVAIGLGLVTGTFTTTAAYSGALMMILYYFPVLDFPYIGEHGWLIDDHLLYALTLVLLAQLHAGQIYGLDALIAKYLGKKSS